MLRDVEIPSPREGYLTNNYYSITPVHLFVIEGTASIAERQKLREERITGLYNIRECVYAYISAEREGGVFEYYLLSYIGQSRSY